MIICKNSTIPTHKKYRDTQFSTVKRRTGKESVPFLGLDTGEHVVKFCNETRSAVLSVKVWISPFGWAWKILHPTKPD